MNNLNEPTRMERFDQNGRQVLHDDYTPIVRHHWYKYLLAILMVFTVVSSVFAASVTTSVKKSITKSYSSANIIKTRNVNAVLKDKKPFSVLLMGTDTGELNRTDKGRTDSIMVMTVNPDSKQANLVSIPRDATISVIGHEDTFPQKMNAAYTFGSAATSIKEVEAYLNVPIDFYAVVNMGGLEKMIDQVGGVQVNAPLSFTYSQATAHDYGPDLYRFTEGQSSYDYAASGNPDDFKHFTTMNGQAALAFSRMRYDDPQGDYGRQQRQRLILEALVKKASNVSTVLNTKFMNSVSDNLKTDLTFDDLLTIGRYYSDARKNLVSDHLQGQGVMFDGVSYEVVPQSEKQRVTDKLRESLALPKATTGKTFGGDVNLDQVDPAFTAVADDVPSSAQQPLAQ